MPNYLIGRYSTGIQETIAAASDLLDTRLEQLDTTNNVILGKDILLTERDAQECVGWALFTGFSVIPAYHLHTADSLVITTNT